MSSPVRRTVVLIDTSPLAETVVVSAAAAALSGRSAISRKSWSPNVQ
jgi:hypothetical protein